MIKEQDKEEDGNSFSVTDMAPIVSKVAFEAAVVKVEVEFFEGWKPLSPLQLAVEEVFKEEVIPFINSLRASFKYFENGLHSELNEVKTVFNQMEVVIEQCSVDKKYFDIQKKELSLDYDRLLDHIICQDVINIVMHDNSIPVNVLPANHKCLVDGNLEIHIMEHDYIDEYNENLVLKAELVKKEQMVEKKILMKFLLNNISLNNRNAPEILEFFKINEWQAKLDAKDVSIANLKKHIESLKGKNVVEKDATQNKAKVIAPGMFKLDLEPLSPNVLKNKDAHIDYIKHTQENTDILRELVEHARALKPLNSDLDFAWVDYYKTQDSNKLVLPSIRIKSSTSASRSQPSSNTKNHRISRTTSSNQKNKIEDQPKSVKSNSNKMNRVIEDVCNANVKHSMLNANSELICATCNECMFDAIHDLCVLDFVNDVNVRSKSAKRQTFTIVGNMCPLNRITSTKVEPLKENTSKSVTTPNIEIKIYRKKTKVAKLVDLSSEPGILGSRPSNISKPNKQWGSTVSKSLYSSLVSEAYAVSKDFEELKTIA
ncbi:hypothetical protein Tco_0039035 [Tanacetum coccineum]